MHGSSTSMRLHCDIVGDIAVIKDAPPDTQLRIAESIMNRNKNVKVVLAQSSPVEGTLRICKFKVVAGENRTFTVHRENGCLFHIDLATVHFSPRLIQERRLVAESARPGECILNMFGGAGTFSIEIAKKWPTKVFNIDINPEAIRLCLRNILANRLRGRVTAVLADAKEATIILFVAWMDRVLLPLPEKSREYLSAAVSALKQRGAIQYYDFIDATKNESPADKMWKRIRLLIDEDRITLGKARIVKSVAPRRYLVSLDLRKS